MSIGGINTDVALMAVKQGRMGDIGTAMLSKALDQQATEGDGIIKMLDAAVMERSVNPAVGGNFDISV
ncbi:MAG: YjfB family protein [Lachnospiraceae bacterium]|nr:YjfB family protein [Lachnospiraceae bacterium]